MLAVTSTVAPWREIGLPITSRSRAASDDRVRGPTHVRQQHRELVAAQPGDHAGLTDRLDEPLGDLDQHGVGDLAAVGVVDGTEAVDVDQQERQVAIVTLALEHRLGPVEQPQPVGQAGQIVGVHRRRHLGPGLDLTGDVPGVDDEPADGRVVAEVGDHGLDVAPVTGRILQAQPGGPTLAVVLAHQQLEQVGGTVVGVHELEQARLLTIARADAGAQQIGGRRAGEGDRALHVDDQHEVADVLHERVEQLRGGLLVGVVTGHRRGLVGQRRVADHRHRVDLAERVAVHDQRHVHDLGMTFAVEQGQASAPGADLHQHRHGPHEEVGLGPLVDHPQRGAIRQPVRLVVVGHPHVERLVHPDRPTARPAEHGHRVIGEAEGLEQHPPGLEVLVRSGVVDDQQAPRQQPVRDGARRRRMAPRGEIVLLVDRIDGPQPFHPFDLLAHDRLVDPGVRPAVEPVDRPGGRPTVQPADQTALQPGVHLSGDIDPIDGADCGGANCSGSTGPGKHPLADEPASPTQQLRLGLEVPRSRAGLVAGRILVIDCTHICSIRPNADCRRNHRHATPSGFNRHDRQES